MAYDPGIADVPAARLRANRLLPRMLAGIDPIPDRRGETFQILTTIFVRPGLELVRSMARAAPQLRLERDASVRGRAGRASWRRLARPSRSLQSPTLAHVSARSCPGLGSG